MSPSANAELFARLLAQRHRPGPVGRLFDDAAARGVLVQAQRGGKQLAQVSAAWREVVPPQLDDQSEVQAVDQGVVAVIALTQTAAALIRQQRGRLLQALQARVREVRALRIDVQRRGEEK